MTQWTRKTQAKQGVAKMAPYDLALLMTKRLAMPEDMDGHDGRVLLNQLNLSLKLN